jgi:thiol-disulfide isomerase/thioredoxin
LPLSIQPSLPTVVLTFTIRLSSNLTLEIRTVSARGCTAWPGLLWFALTAIGCGQQVAIDTDTGPEPGGTAATPATASASLEASSEPGTAAAPAQPAAPGSTAAAPAADASRVTLEKVSFADLMKRIADNPRKPRYTIVDAWASWCGPCKENFPHVVEMHHKYAAKGLAVASLSFDDPEEKKQVDDALAFLREKNATCSNYLLVEPGSDGFEKFRVNGIPAVFLYGPDGKELKRFTMDDPDNQFTYDQVEKTVVELLEGKSS